MVWFSIGAGLRLPLPRGSGPYRAHLRPHRAPRPSRCQPVPSSASRRCSSPTCRSSRSPHRLLATPVKSEAVSICRKLGACSRSQAVSRSRDLGLRRQVKTGLVPFTPVGRCHCGLGEVESRGVGGQRDWSQGSGHTCTGGRNGVGNNRTSRGSARAPRGRPRLGAGPVRVCPAVVMGVSARAACLLTGALMVRPIRAFLATPGPARPTRPAQHPAGLTEVHVCGGSARSWPPASVGAYDDDG
jgi:hypothetical protein